MGNPEGGPYDETPPHLIGTSPRINAVGYKDKKIELHFDEFVKVDNASENVIISPPQLESPKISSSATKTITVQLNEDLLPNTTYSIDFGDAIVDNNEGNEFGNYAFIFSTGNVVDTLQIAGSVLDAETLDPIKNILVGVYPVDPNSAKANADSSFFKKPLTRISRTDAKGAFRIKGIAPGTYQVVALLDGDQNFMFNQKSEQIAFLKEFVSPTSVMATRQDTTWRMTRDSISLDSIRAVPYTRYLPDNLLLRAFKENTETRYFLKGERPNLSNFWLVFSGGSTELPKLTGLNFNADDLILERSEHNDSLRYWTKDTLMAKIDTLRFGISFLATDSTGHLALTHDTLEVAQKITKRDFSPSDKKGLKKKKKKDEDEEFPKESDMKFLECRISPGASMDILNNFILSFDEPILRFDTAMIHLQEKKEKDTLWHEKPFVIEQDSMHIREYTIKAEWNPGMSYQLLLDSTAFHGIYGLFTAPKEQKVKVKKLEDYASLFLSIKGVNGAGIVELLNERGKTVRREMLEHGQADFYFIKPGKYFVRLINDRNGNGRWDPGNYANRELPEEVYYCPSTFELRALCDLDYNWNVSDLPFDMQKPQSIRTKVSEKTKKQSRNAKIAKYRNSSTLSNQ